MKVVFSPDGKLLAIALIIEICLFGVPVMGLSLSAGVGSEPRSWHFHR